MINKKDDQTTLTCSTNKLELGQDGWDPNLFIYVLVQFSSWLRPFGGTLWPQRHLAFIFKSPFQYLSLDSFFRIIIAKLI